MINHFFIQIQIYRRLNKVRKKIGIAVSFVTSLQQILKVKLLGLKGSRIISIWVRVLREFLPLFVLAKPITGNWRNVDHKILLAGILSLMKYQMFYALTLIPIRRDLTSHRGERVFDRFNQPINTAATVFMWGGGH